ncbi:hypothetical protein MNBD_ALPHA12-569 [hydrothermal vent metagenome]|uniref:Uncharacterized protein n=1 Tax=hydrothermal vent metagenome TaxID=652676 RepID=A0A3B0UDU3_9ZZZZ
MTRIVDLARKAPFARHFGARRLRLFAGFGVMMVVLAGCTTIEGTNAFSDIATFEREVMSETVKGIGLVPRDEKPPIKTPRAPLVLPGHDQNNLPAPTTANLDALPKDSDTVQIDMSGISEADLKRLRNARVVDLRTFAGRPLTEAETRQLTAQMKADRITGTGVRPLYLPPDRYFTTINNVDMICLAPNGKLVPLDDPTCPPAIRAALLSK